MYGVLVMQGRKNGSDERNKLVCVLRWLPALTGTLMLYLVATRTKLCVHMHHQQIHYVVLSVNQFNHSLYRGADKSLARPGRKQATATEDFDVHISYL